MADKRIQAALPNDFRVAVYYIDVQGYTYAETAAMLNIPHGTVMSRLARGRKRLRVALAHVAANRERGLPSAPPLRPGLRLHARRRDALRVRRRAAASHPSRGSVLGTRRRRYPLLERQQPRRHEVPLPSSTQRNWKRASTCVRRPSPMRPDPL